MTFSDSKTAMQGFEDLEKLLDTCFMKLINRKCRIIIANSPENRKLIKSSEVIDYRNDVFIVEA